MQKIVATLNGTGAAMYVGLGFIPDKLTLRNLEGAGTIYTLEWLRGARGIASSGYNEGILYTDGTASELTKGAGVRPYYGGDIITAAQATSAAHLIRVASEDKRNIAGNGGNISRWTLGSAANFTGNWDYTCDTTYIGIGSPITIMEDVTKATKKSFVTALTSNGEQANEVTLADNISTGDIVFLGNMYDMVAATAGIVMPEGFVLNATSGINASGQILCIEAELFE